MVSLEQFWKFLTEAAKLLNYKIGDDLTNKIYSYFKSDRSLKNMNRWRIIRLMKQYEIVTRDVFEDAIRKFNEEHCIDSEGNLHKKTEVKIQEATQQMWKEAEEEAAENDSKITVKNQFKNVATDIEEKHKAIKKILNHNNKPIDKTKEDEFIELLSNEENYNKGIQIWFRKDKDISKRVRFSKLKEPLIKFLDGIKDYSKWWGPDY